MSDRIRNEGAELAPPDPPAKPPPAPSPKPPAEPPPPAAEKPEPAEAKEAVPKEAGAKDDAEPKETDTEADSARKTLERNERRAKDAVRRRYEAERERDLLRQNLEQLQAQVRAQSAPQPGQPPSDAIAEAKRQLLLEQAHAQFNQACNQTAAQGRAEYGEVAFKEAVDTLNTAVGAGTRFDFLDAVTQIPDGHRLYPMLAADLDKAAEILRLPPMRMAVELAKLALNAPAAQANGLATEPASAAAVVSNAPPPIRPIRGGTARNPSAANETMAEFIKRRDAEEAAKRRI